MSINKTYYAVDFEEVEAINNPEINSVLNMVKESGLKKFLSCATSFSIPITKQLFATARIIHGSIVCSIKKENYIISQQFFTDSLELLTGGLGKVSNIPDGNTDMWKLGFSNSESLMSIPAEKHQLKSEFRLLANIVAKALLARAGAYDKITLLKFQYMALIASRIGVDWSGILFSSLREMVTGKGRSEGFYLQICYLLGLLNAPLELMEPLHSRKCVNAAMVADFLKRNVPGSSPLKKSPKPQGEKTKKSKSSKRKTVSDSEPDDVLIQTVFSSPKKVTPPRKPRSKKPKIASENLQPEVVEEEPQAKVGLEEPQPEAVSEKPQHEE